MTKKVEKVPYHEEFSNKVIAALETNSAPWQKPWKLSFFGLPKNAATEKEYTGSNILSLLLQGFEDNRFMTFVQAKKAGYSVKKGAKGSRIIYWNKTAKVVENEEGEEEVIKRGFFKTSCVFNASQIEGIEPLPEREITWEPIGRAEALINGSGAVVENTAQDKACYWHAADKIQMPPRSAFDRAEDYYGTLIHELAHWTGAPHRLNRVKGKVFGDKLYAREELRAEIASWMICGELGLEHNGDRSAAYVKNWVEDLKEDSYEIIRACQDAEQIRNMIMDFEG